MNPSCSDPHGTIFEVCLGFNQFAEVGGAVLLESSSSRCP